MQTPSFDPGLTQQFMLPLRRVINKDGSFNVHRRGTTWHDFHPYLRLINTRWPNFLLIVLAGYLAANLFFASVYFALGPGELQGGDAPTEARRFLNAFFFSSHTLSTVGFGNIAPRGLAANAVASLEALVGVLGFAMATGLLYGRFSRPSARLGFSRNMLVSPYGEGTALEFRVVNRRSNSLMELDVRMMLMTVERSGGEPRRKYEMLRVERKQLLFLPLTWTVVHPIDTHSPFAGRTAEELDRLQAEVLILVKAYDDTFSQTVLARHSYRHDEMVWGTRFAPAFHVDGEGDLVLDLARVSETVS
jgi:inward rectifier potassium channel